MGWAELGKVLLLLLPVLAAPLSQGGVPRVTVALTRELGKNAKLQARLEELEPGLETAEIPCIAHCDLETAAEVPRLLADADPFDYVIITSPEAAEVFLRLCGEDVFEASSFELATVGDATAAVLRKNGLEPGFLPSRALGKVLAAELPPRGSNRVLYPASRRAARTIQEGLGERGFSVTRVNTYDTVSADWSDAAQAAAEASGIVTFASPSAVKVWTERVPGARSMLVACIGETSAKQCRELGYSRVNFPEKPGIDSWADTVLECARRLRDEAKTA